MASTTKESLGAALKQMLTVKPIDKITVKDLVEICGVNTAHLKTLKNDEMVELLRRSHVLIVCGDEVDEAVKNDIAVAQRLGITATTLDGILKIRSQGHEEAR